MTDEYISIQEAAKLMRKSTQTVRRMIKRGEISAQQVKTPQGFQYILEKSSLPGFKSANKMEAEGEPVYAQGEVDKPQEREDNLVDLDENSSPLQDNKKDEEYSEESTIQMLSNSTIQSTIQTQNNDSNKQHNEIRLVKNNNLTNQHSIQPIQMRKITTIDKNFKNLGQKVDKLLQEIGKSNEQHAQLKSALTTLSSKQTQILSDAQQADSSSSHLNHSNEALRQALQNSYREHQALVNILEKLQKKLEKERRRPRGFLVIFIEAILGFLWRRRR